MGKIVKLKNKKTGVKVYPVTATSAVVDANSGERLNDTLMNKVEEAPMDGAQYVRKNGGWEVAEVSMDPNEICRINLKSNQGDADNSSLNGATVNVVNTVTSEVIYNGTWNGSEIQLSIPGATSYKVTVGDVADYKTPDAITIEATAFSSRDLIMTYQTEVVSVTLSSDNGVSVVGQVVTINGKTHTWNGTAISQKVAFGVSYSVSVNGKTGYAAPSGGSFTSSIAARTLNLIYKNVSYGVFIYGDDGFLHEVSENYTGGIVGAALITDKVELIVNNVIEDGFIRQADNALTIFPTPITDEELAREDYNGYGNYTVFKQGAEITNRFNITLDGDYAYAPALGELEAIIDNRVKINKVLDLMGVPNIVNIYDNNNSDYAYISSTVYEPDNSHSTVKVWSMYKNGTVGYFGHNVYAYGSSSISLSDIYSIICFKLRNS